MNTLNHKISADSAVHKYYNAVLPRLLLLLLLIVQIVKLIKYMVGPNKLTTLKLSFSLSYFIYLRLLKVRLLLVVQLVNCFFFFE